MIGYHDVPVEVRKLVDEAVSDLLEAQHHLRQSNFGLAYDHIQFAKDKLPRDVGETVVWHELERRTSA